ILEFPREARSRSRPGDRGHHDAVDLTAYPRSLGLEEDGNGPQVEAAPPPPSTALVVQRGATMALRALPPPVRRCADLDNELVLLLHEIPPLNHSLLDSEEALHYPVDGRHVADRLVGLSTSPILRDLRGVRYVP